jgi:regulator of cell morphogenesis and NO signaling
MAIDNTRTVREIALEVPSSVQVFESLGIDYCCGGERRLSEACAAAGVPVEKVNAALQSLNTDSQSRTMPAAQWTGRPLSDLVGHISGTHHVYVRAQIPTITALLDKVVEKHGGNHRELATLRDSFAALGEELTMHLMKEEQILFPYIIRSDTGGQAAQPSCFGSVENPIRMMRFEHDNAGEALREMRRLTSGYRVPEDACTSYRALYRLLQEFEADLHRHIHLENNILFPRALEAAGVVA